jgi:hypothetical protein
MYLKVANLMIIMLVVLIVFLAGYLTLKITKNMWYALIVQFSPFCHRHHLWEYRQAAH